MWLIVMLKKALLRPKPGKKSSKHSNLQLQEQTKKMRKKKNKNKQKKQSAKSVKK